MPLFFHSDDVDQLIPFKEAVQITENALRDMISSDGVCAPRKRLNLHRNVAEGSFDTVLNIYAGGAEKRLPVARKSARRSIRIKPSWH